MSDISKNLISGSSGNPPLLTLPWKDEAEKIISWAKNKCSTHKAFIFDLLMSMAYVDTIPNIQKNIERQDDLHSGYNAHLGFINLCSPCLLNNNQWRYQKAAKPQSRAIGKLTSEIILKCIELYFDNFLKVKSIGGIGLVDAVLIHQDGRVILCEVKASPLTTFPFLFDFPNSLGDISQLTRTQVGMARSALYMHHEHVIPLGRSSDYLWPFKAASDFITNSNNYGIVCQFVERWDTIRTAYKNKNRNSKYYYIANASGHPPRIAKDHFNWPDRESVSDSKTSAGLDRTDDIKKGIYQTFKLSIEASKQFPNQNIKTALISNLPAYRHGNEYIDPFHEIYWGQESSFKKDLDGRYFCCETDLKRPFDYIIALDNAFTRGESL